MGFRTALARISSDALYDRAKGPTEGIKTFLQMVTGVTGVVVVAVAVVRDFKGNSGAQDMTTHVLAIIATTLAVAAALELAYTLFTPGPDEAIDPLMLGLSSVLLYLISTLKSLTWTAGVSILLFAITLGLLFAIRKKFIDDSDVRTNQAARRAALEPEVRKFVGENNIGAALDLLGLAEFAWHDRYGEIGLPEIMRTEVLHDSHQELSKMIILIKAWIEDPNRASHLA
jgi:hypothetical protein